MRCIHCGNEMGDDHRFCSFCGGENMPVAAVLQQDMQPAPRKKSGALKWILVSIWLALAVAGWVAALILTLGGKTESSVEKQEAYRRNDFAALTEGDWYQWDIQTDTLYCWHFLENGTAEYSVPGSDEWHQVEYTVAEGSNAVQIACGDTPVVWEYDPLEGCFWAYEKSGSQTCKVRIFPAKGIPAGTAKDYTYRVDNGMAYVAVEFDNITELDKAAAEKLLDRYSCYINFGICATGVVESQKEADAAMAAVGPKENQQIYSAGKVPCCRTVDQMHRHLRHMFGSDLLGQIGEGAAMPGEYNGSIYYFVPAMGFSGFFMTGDLTEQSDGTYTAVLGMDFAEDDTYLATFAREDGTWKLVDVQLQVSDENIPELTADAAWQLLDRTDAGWLLHYFYGTGTVDESDVYSYSPMPDSPDFRVDCPSVTGVDSAAQLRNLLRQHYTQNYIDSHFMQVSYHCDRRDADIYGGSWFEANGTVYFEPNWGAGDPMLLRETMRIRKTGVDSWTVTVEREFYTEPETFRIVWENGAFKLDA